MEALAEKISSKKHEQGEYIIVLQYRTDKWIIVKHNEGFPSGSDGKESACSVGDLGSIPGSGESPGEGNDNPLQYSCLENPMERGAWQAAVYGVAKSWTRLSDFTLSETSEYLGYSKVISPVFPFYTIVLSDLHCIFFSF